MDRIRQLIQSLTTGSFRAGSIWGIPVEVHRSTIAFVVLISLMMAIASGHASMLLFAPLVLTTMFGIVLLHELGHVYAAARCRIRCRKIIITPLGGLALLEHLSCQPWERLCIVAAGPAVNAVLAFFLFPWSDMPGIVGMLASLFFTANLYMIGFNLLPVYPLDGHHVFVAVFQMMTGETQARAFRILRWLAPVVAIPAFFFFLHVGSVMGAMLIAGCAVLTEIQCRAEQQKAARRSAINNCICKFKNELSTASADGDRNRLLMLVAEQLAQHWMTRPRFSQKTFNKQLVGAMNYSAISSDQFQTDFVQGNKSKQKAFASSIVKHILKS